MFRNWIKRSFIIGLGFSLSAPVVSHAYGEASVIQSYVASKALVPLIKPSWGNFILHSETLDKLYSLRSYEAIWVDSKGVPTVMAQALRGILLSADRHGLNVSDYWDGDVENLYKASFSNPRNWITFELAATEAMIRYVTHLSVGRFDPMQIDDDIKFKAKTFNEFNELNAAISYGPQSMGPALDNFAPNYQTHYSDLMRSLEKLNKVRTQGGWERLPQSPVNLDKNVKHPLVSKLRSRLFGLGYLESDSGSDLYDADFKETVRRFQQENGMISDGVISAGSSGVINGLNDKTVNERINQVIVNMEKLRWLPRNMEARHIFVNLGTSEVRVFREDGNPVLIFNSVSGQPFRRTPSMRDTITYVNFNPYWTAPRSIIVKDKLPELRKKGQRYLDENDMILIRESDDKVATQEEMWRIPWSTLTPKTFPYYIKQKPKKKNALGVVKFPLQNPWAIYLHDTNQPELFETHDRHQSSGCVRLAQALNLAAYLLEGVVKEKARYQWQQDTMWTLDEILNFTPATDWERVPKEQEDVKVNIPKHMPVYMLYLTALSNDRGAMRFLKDPYGQDQRILQAIKNYRAKGELF